MICEKKTGNYHYCVVAGACDPLSGANRRETVHLSKGMMVPARYRAPAADRRLNGEVRLIDLERRARFSRPISGSA